MTIDWQSITDEAVQHLQALIRIDTTNPPGNEQAAADCLAQLLAREGYAPVVLTSAPGRGNVVARYKGRGDAAPLLLLSHLDVVPAEPAQWEHNPFGGEIVDGMIWGRGALDMKSIVTMQLMTMLLLQRGQIPLARDVIFAATADEEAGGEYGAGFLVENHPELIRAEHALSEFGGFPLEFGGRTIYFCQAAEKGFCWLRMRARGQPGHGSMPHPDNATVKLAEAVGKLGRARLPYHRTQAVTEMIHGMANAIGGMQGAVLRLLLHPTLHPLALRALASSSFERFFYALLHNTVSPTVLQAGSKTNVIPSEAVAELDGRTLPGQDMESLIGELEAVIGPGFEFEPIHLGPPLAISSETVLFATMARVLQRHDPGAAVAPLMMAGGTDAKHIARLGIPCYGFSPMRLPPEFNFLAMVHGHNERIPIDGLAFGVQALYEVVEEYCQ
ncbi:MAG: M20/M25/M40 family metallo-hydrolase [Anaerolineae bacterium]|nr:M20/M25/M40 family metallo-hydrolase [Anaerolineae bacterium]